MDRHVEVFAQEPKILPPVAGVVHKDGVNVDLAAGAIDHDELRRQTRSPFRVVREAHIGQNGGRGREIVTIDDQVEITMVAGLVADQGIDGPTSLQDGRDCGAGEGFEYVEDVMLMHETAPLVKWREVPDRAVGMRVTGGGAAGYMGARIPAADYHPVMPELPVTESPETFIEEPAGSLDALASGDPADVAARFPTCLAAWAALGDRALDEGRVVEAYACYRTGYHRGLDRIRRAGWRGSGRVPWAHEGNRGFLRSLGGLGRAAAAIGEKDEEIRCAEFLSQLAPDAS